MNILFINSRKAASYGGGEKWILTAGKELQNQGHHVTIAGTPQALLLKYAQEQSLDTIEIRIPRDLSLITTWKLRRYMKDHAFDTIVCNTNRDVRVAGLAAKIAGIPNVFARHGLQIITHKKRYTLPLIYLTRGIITNTQSIKEEYERYAVFPPNFVKVVANGMEQVEALAPHDFSAQYPGKKIIFSAGRLTAQKGFNTLIHAAALLRRRRDDLMFLIAGKGELTEDLLQLITHHRLEHHVTLMGFHDSIYPFIKGADVFALSSLSEGMPNVVMEAMMLKTPVVATRVNGVPELITHNESGIIVRPSCPAELADGIEHLLDSEALTSRLTRNAYQTITTRFSKEKMVQRLVHIFSENSQEMHS